VNPSPSVKQALHFFTLVDQKGTPDEQLQALYSSGLIADLLDADVSNVNRDEFRRVLGLKPLIPTLTVWKTIKLGVHKTPDAYRQSILAQKGTRIYQYADQILDKVTVSPAETEIDLAIVTAADLGFKGKTRHDVICKRIVEIGAQLCPNEVGPALRDQYADQPSGEHNVIAMESLTNSDGDPIVFTVDDDNIERWLSMYKSNPDKTWYSDSRFVVTVPRKS
jgi:hypothetical protein